MQKRLRLRWFLGIMVALIAVGCSGKDQSKKANGAHPVQGDAPVACAPVQYGVGVCVNGKPMTWAGGVKPPHMHEEGGYYAAVDELAATLGVKVEVAADKGFIAVNGKRVASLAEGAKNIHDHEGTLFAPIKEFAEAAGYHVTLDRTRDIVSITK